MIPPAVTVRRFLPVRLGLVGRGCRYPGQRRRVNVYIVGRCKLRSAGEAGVAADTLPE